MGRMEWSEGGGKWDNCNSISINLFKKLKKNMLSEKSSSPKATCCMIPFTQHSGHDISDCQGFRSGVGVTTERATWGTLVATEFSVSCLYQCQHPGCDIVLYRVLQVVIMAEGNWVKGTQNLCIISYNGMQIYNYAKIKSLINTITQKYYIFPWELCEVYQDV